MSPRSQEFLAVARKRLRSANTIVDDDPATALSAAYYAALYAARAALSEQDVSARTHRGTWHEFRQRFVVDGSVPAETAAPIRRLQAVRERADYDAAHVPDDEARAALAAVATFVDAVAGALDDVSDPE